MKLFTPAWPMAPVYDKEQVLLLLSEEGNDNTAVDAGGSERLAHKTVHKEFTDIPFFQFQLRRTGMIDHVDCRDTVRLFSQS